ncbi:hypothetical protein GR160_10710 [Flavobacterium sp. Sd200]|uniref:hypothetical protein n=1 Tax=Flavobacterium sp. Sd200 TaxID=2692211 RepID=UPI00136EF265|nr:hypothetical protein [Flavobacterium sp. Sd200]MXN91697.1 hypothetical protein [Flavobacterium sp. Sd200]
MAKHLDIEKFELFPHERTLGKGDNIPKGRGLYAWYIDFSKFKNFNTVEEFSKKIELINNLISLDAITGNVKSFFRNYSVSLSESRLFIDKFLIDDTEEEIIFGDKLKNLSVDDCRKIMELLANFSILVNPLYVGISSSLRTRWEQHHKAFTTIKELQGNNEDEGYLKALAQKSFGGRVAYKGFNWEYLIFACVEKDIDRKLINETEFLINRLYNPLFGRK